MRHSVGIFLLALAGCGQLGLTGGAPEAPVAGAGARSESAPEVRPDRARTPPPAARTAEQFDTTTPEERAQAAAPAAGPSAALGLTVASLGDPAEPGFWLETPLVSEETPGRVEYDGASAAVTLRPIAGPATAGSRLSLAAMRLIGAPLTGLPEVAVFRD